jgi:shikimate kinase
MDNIIFIGLPGCGKSTIGALVAERLRMPFFDADNVTETLSGETIPQMFEKGEPYFRQRETEAIRYLCTKSHSVISCGGGVVTRRENMEQLKAAGTIFFLDRPVEEIIATVDPSNRPLIRDNRMKIKRLDEERRPLYKQYADIIVPVKSPFKKVVPLIEKDWLRLHK